MQYPEKVMLAIQILEAYGFNQWEIEYLLKTKDVDALIESYTHK